MTTINSTSFSKNPYRYLQSVIQSLAKEAFTVQINEDDFELKEPTVATFGDYATNIPFVLARLLKKHPSEISETLQKELQKIIPNNLMRVEIAGNGFINFFITFYGWHCIAQKLSPPRPHKYFLKEKIIIEFSSPNVAKPMHIGHLRATILGNALAHLYYHNGIKPITWNHIGDWGTQFGKLLVAYKKWGNQSIIEENPIEELQKLYVEFHHKAKDDPTLEDDARKEFKRLELGDTQNKRIWKYIVDQSLKEFNRMYQILRVAFDYTIGESFYESRLQPFITRLKKNNITQESQGALIIPLSNPTLPPALIQKSDGATLYFTRDLVSLKYRAQKIKPSRMLYIVGNEQALHFKQLQEVNTILHLTTIPFEHISFGLVLNALGKKFSTRSGDIITAQEVLNEVFARAQVIQNKKNPNLSDSEKLQKTHQLGLGVIQYSMLKSNRTSDISFDFDSMFALSGNSFPYIQYTYARIRSILQKAPKARSKDFTQLTKDNLADFTLIKTLSGFEGAINESITWRSLHHLTDYLFSLANATNTVYEKSPILSDSNKKMREARIQLLTLSASTIKYGLGILGIEVQEKM